MVNRWLNSTPVTIEEIRVGNKFFHPVLRNCVITDIDENGTIQFKDSITGDTYVNETVESIQPICLTDGGNIMVEKNWLSSAGFIFTDHNVCEKQGVVIVQKTIDSCWIIRKGLDIRKVYFQHELQNAYFDLTGEEIK